MVSSRRWLIRLGLALAIGIPAVAQASDAPHTPQRMAPDDLIVTEVFATAPLSFDFPESRRGRVDAGHRQDFEIIYDRPYDEVRDFLQQSYRDVTDVATMDADAMDYLDALPLRLMGIQLGDSGGRLTLGNPDIRFSLVAEVEPHRRDQTRVVIHNRISSRHVSGFSPVRAPFRPVDTAPIPFRWQ